MSEKERTDVVPPKWVRNSVWLLAKHGQRDEVLGDLMENYLIRANEKGKDSADRWAAREAGGALLWGAWRVGTRIVRIILVAN